MNRPEYRGKLFLYPCAGKDIEPAVVAFGQFLDTFIFVDLNYKINQMTAPTIPEYDYVEGSRRVWGKSVAELRVIREGKCKYRFLEPAWLCFDYRQQGTGRQIQVILRRGFGQYALHELKDGTLTLFMHRGDTSGDGGSSTFFLANHKMDHPPLSELLNVIKRKLTDPGFILSDGSNTNIQQVFGAGEGHHTITEFNSHGLHWLRQGVLKAKDSRTSVLWKVTPS